MTVVLFFDQCEYSPADLSLGQSPIDYPPATFSVARSPLARALRSGSSRRRPIAAHLYLARSSPFPRPPLGRDPVHVLDGQSGTVFALKTVEDIGYPPDPLSRLYLDPPVRTLVDIDLVAGFDTNVHEKFLARRDLAFGGDGQGAHGTNLRLERCGT